MLREMLNERVVDFGGRGSGRRGRGEGGVDGGGGKGRIFTHLNFRSFSEITYI